MDYKEGKKPPKCKNVIPTPEELVEKLKPLIGKRSTSFFERIDR